MKLSTKLEKYIDSNRQRTDLTNYTFSQDIKEIFESWLDNTIDKTISLQIKDMMDKK